MVNRPKGIDSQRNHFLQGCKYIIKAVTAYCDDPPEFLGIDQSRGSTGYCYRDKKDKLQMDKIVPSSVGFSKVIDVEKGIRKVLGERNPFIAIEGYSMNAKFGRESAGELGGVLRRLFYFKHRPLLVIAPLSLKSWVKAKSKDQVMMEILDRYGIKIPSNDVADAFILQEMVHKTYLLAKAVVEDEVKLDDVRLYLKNCEYERTVGSLYRYQEGALFRLIFSQGTWVKFWNRKVKDNEKKADKETKS